MSDEPESAILVYLRRIDAKVDRLAPEMQDVKHRLTALDLSVARLAGDIAGIRGDYAGLQVRMDRMNARLDRIDRRLELQDARP